VRAAGALESIPARIRSNRVRGATPISTWAGGVLGGGRREPARLHRAPAASQDTIMADLAADTVAQWLRGAPTRDAALGALERHTAPIPTAVAMGAAPALLELLSMDEGEVDRGAFDRAGLLLGRLEAEAPPDDGRALHGAALGDGGYEKLYRANSMAHAALRKPASELTRADARSYACSRAFEAPSFVRGCTETFAAAGLGSMEYFGLWMSAEPIVSKKLMPADDVPRQMLTLSLELLESNELPDLAIGAAWYAVQFCLTGRASLGPTALELGIYEAAAAHLSAIGSPADWVSISRGAAGRANYILSGVNDLDKLFRGQSARPDLAALVSSGVFDQCLGAVSAVAAAGADGLQNTNHGVLYVALGTLRNCRAQPGCEAKIRSIADALGFCLMNDLDNVQAIGATTGGAAAQICESERDSAPLAARACKESLISRLLLLYGVAGCGVFGRDEGGSDFTFSSQHVEMLYESR
jgi:hypothetical protein